MNTQLKRMDVLSNNIANADTTGFKRDIPITRAFTEELLKRLHDSNDTLAEAILPPSIAGTNVTPVGNIDLGVFINSVYTDFTAGRTELTGGTFDLAIEGDGFFVVNGTDENGQAVERYTRDGTFVLDNQRNLATIDGYTVAGENGVLNIPFGDVSINLNGEVYVDNVYLDTLRVAAFEDLQTLRKVGDNFYSATDESVEADFNGSVMQGYKEGSNINAVTEMVSMITVQRAYEANQRMITHQDTILGRAVSDIARR
jgi:flagellar basal-body rod protein FlgG